MDFSKYTPTELLNLGNEFVEKHEELKNGIIKKGKEIEKLEKEIKTQNEELKTIEEIYTVLIKEIKKRPNNNEK